MGDSAAADGADQSLVLRSWHLCEIAAAAVSRTTKHIILIDGAIKRTRIIIISAYDVYVQCMVRTLLRKLVNRTQKRNNNEVASWKYSVIANEI